jgi:DNA-binding protein YbaB
MGEFERLRSGLGDLQKRLMAVNATVRSSDGYVSATVGPRGQLLRLDLDPRIYRRPDSRELAKTITETIQKATAEAMQKVEEACRPYLPSEEIRAHMDYDFDGIFRRMDSELETLAEGERR